MLGDLACHELTRQRKLGRRCAGRRHEPRSRIGRIGQHRVEAGDVEPRDRERALEPIALGRVGGRVEFNEDLARFDALPVLDMDGADHTNLERLDHLGASALNDLARRASDELDVPERRPGEREHKEEDDAGADRPPDGRGRGLDDFQGRRQKLELIAAPPAMLQGARGYDQLRRLHAGLPERGAAGRSCRPCGSAPRERHPRRCGRARS